MKYTDEEISRAARELHREWESPQLWPRIQAALAAEAARAERSRALHVRGWLSLAAAAAVLVFGVSVLLRARAPLPGVPAAEAERRLLTDKALREVERTESDYVRSIDELSRVAAPKVEEAGSPLMMGYREKLLLLDSAIAECRARIDRNRFNALLRRELLSLYQEKQHTLQQVMKEETDAL
ncbi:MAG: hypothetical protein DMF82_10605 [Acidobacteria bacterium]|nr:MAG: hypothetical protein DMF82_10605 [Acidobacteriota bacterium]